MASLRLKLKWTEIDNKEETINKYQKKIRNKERDFRNSKRMEVVQPFNIEHENKERED